MLCCRNLVDWCNRATAIRFFVPDCTYKKLEVSVPDVKTRRFLLSVPTSIPHPVESFYKDTFCVLTVCRAVFMLPVACADGAETAE
jgi:hypothetical protein